jgi:hypothetical protein
VDASIRNASDKTLELWQVLGSVENLLVGPAPLVPVSQPAPSILTRGWASVCVQERCEQGLKTKVIKKRGEKGRAAAGPVDLALERKKAMERLDAIAMYMTDFQDIVDEYQVQKRLAALSGLSGQGPGAETQSNEVHV